MPSWAQSPAGCGTKDRIVDISSLEDIPKACHLNRKNNYAYNNSEGDGISKEKICQIATYGESNDHQNWKNVSSCFCGKNLFKMNGEVKPMTCWVLYDE